MPPFVPLADGAQVHLGFVYGGKSMENRFWFVSRQPPITDSTLLDLATGVRDWYLARLWPGLPQTVLFRAVTAIDWSGSAPGVPVELDVNTSGAARAVAHSANVSYRVRFKGSSAQTFRDNSHFLVGIPVNAVDVNVVSPSYLTTVRNAYIDLIDLAASFGPFPAWRWVITSRQQNNTWRSTQAFARTDFIQVPSPYVTSRRRRMPRP